MPVLERCSGEINEPRLVSYPTNSTTQEGLCLRVACASLHDRKKVSIVRTSDIGDTKRGVSKWHIAEVQGCYILGLLTGALPTFEPKCRLTAAFQTQRQAVPKVAV